MGKTERAQAHAIWTNQVTAKDKRADESISAIGHLLQILKVNLNAIEH